MSSSIISSIISLSMQCSRDCSGLPLKEVRLDQNAYDSVCVEFLTERLGPSQGDYVNGLVRLYVQGSIIRIRRAE